MFRFHQWQKLLPFKQNCRFYWYRKGFVPQELEPGLYPYPKRQVPRSGIKPLCERLPELRAKSFGMDDLDPVDIGLPYSKPPVQHKTSKNTHLESAARKRTLLVPLDTIHAPDQDSDAPVRRLAIARHYNIFHDLYGAPHFFVPQIHFEINYPVQDEEDQSKLEEDTVLVQTIHMGNLLAAETAMSRPMINLSDAPKDYKWTLVMTCPDEPMGKDDGSPPSNEYVHWLMTNLHSTNNDQTVEGDEIISYMPPLPYQGTGYHRFIFVLYRQDNGIMDLSHLKRSNPKGDLREARQFDTREFYRTLESELTPAGLLFFQSAWDQSVRNYYRNVLDSPEPIFEIEWPDPRQPPQEQFPVADTWTKPRRHPHGLPLIRERFGVHNDVSFDVYLDRYRDRKELLAEIVRERLSMEGNPLDPNEPRRKQSDYPLAEPFPPGMPSWLKKQEIKRRLRVGRWRLLQGHDG